VKFSNFMKLRPVGAELFHADGLLDGQTEMNETDVGFFFAMLPTVLKY
jgi:hypothetical protein